MVVRNNTKLFPFLNRIADSCCFAVALPMPLSGQRSLAKMAHVHPEKNCRQVKVGR